MKRRQFIQTSLQTTIATIVLQQGLSAVAQGDSKVQQVAQSIAAQSTAKSSSGRKLALLVGVTDYEAGGDRTISSLSGCVNDVHLVKNLLIYRYGFAPSDVITLTNEQATRQNILNSIENHLLVANPKDQVVFFFSGHGAQLKDVYGDRPDAQTTGLIPYDYRTNAMTGESNYITGATLFLLRSAFKTNQVTFILDCCYSGGGTRMAVRIKTVQRKSGDAVARPNQEELNYHKQWMEQLNLDRTTFNQKRMAQIGVKGMVMSASRADQVSQDCTFAGKYHAAAFTKFLTDVLWEKADLSLNELQAIVTDSLATIADSPNTAQEPVFIYPSDQSQLQSQPVFFTAAVSSKIAAQGIVLGSDAKTRKVKFWVGGLPHRLLTSEVGTEFRLLTGKNDRNAPIAKLSEPIAADFTAIVTIPDDLPLPKPGTFIRQHYQPISQDLELRVGLDSSVGPINLALGPRIKGIVAQSHGYFDKADVIFSQMNQLYYNTNLNSSQTAAIGSYGLFNPNYGIIPNTFGEPGEPIEKAIDRLAPQFKLQLTRKLFAGMTANAQDLPDENIEAKVWLKNKSKTVIAEPNRSKSTVAFGEVMEVFLQNDSRSFSQALLIGVSPSGSFFHQHFPKGSFQKSFKLSSKDGIGRSGEFMILLSPAGKSLDTLNQQLNELAEELRSTSDRKTRTRKSTSRSSFDGILSSLTSGSGERSTARPLVITLPIHVVDKK